MTYEIEYRNKSLPAPVQALLDSELKQKERVCWMDQPLPDRMAKQARPVLFFAIPWTAFSVFWMVLASRSGNWLFTAFGLPFVFVGLGMLSAPYRARRGAASTVYVLTDERALIISSTGFGSMTVRSFYPGSLGDLHRTQDAEGIGDVVFRTNMNSFHDGDRTAQQVGFLGVRNAKAVEDRVRALVASTPAAGS